MNEKTPELQRMTLRVDPKRREVLERLKAETHQRTASKALWTAARQLPELRAEHRDLCRSWEKLCEAAGRVRTAEAAVSAAAERLEAARSDLADAMLGTLA